MLAQVIHILPLTNIRRKRVLPLPGQVWARVGQKVNAGDVVAQAQLPSGHVVMDIRRGLGVPQASASERSIVRQVGDKLQKGDVVAESGGMFSRIIRAPADGEIVAISAGQVLLRTQTTTMEVTASFTGTVTNIIKDFGVIIETNGALIQGVWGNGRVDSGMLIVTAQSQGEDLTRQQIEVNMRGAVVLGGHCASAAVLQAAEELPLRGLILTSMSSDLIPLARKVSYPVIVIEGFQKTRLNEAARKLLSTSEKRDVSVSAALNPAAGERPEIIIPLPAIGQPALEMDTFKPNQLVRIQGAPYAGRTGTFVQARQGMFTLPSGLKAPCADIQLDSETRVTVPLANLEVIE